LSGSRADGKGGHFDRQLRGSPEPIPGRCGKKIRKTNPPRYCTRWPAKGRNECKHHGGASPIGPANPNWKHGRNSKFFTKNALLRDAYLAALEQGDLTTCREEIAAGVALYEELMRRVDEGGSTSDWKRLAEIGDEMEKAAKRNDVGAGTKLFSEALAILRAGGDGQKAREELQNHIVRMAHLRERESLMRFRSHGQISVDRVLAMATQLAELAIEFIRDENDRRVFTNRLRLLAAGSPERRTA